MKQCGWVMEKYIGIEEEEEVTGLACFDYYDNEVIYPIFSYTLLGILLSQLNIKLKPTLVLEIKSAKQEIFEFYKNLLDDMAIRWEIFSKEYDSEKYNKRKEKNSEYDILDYINCFQDNVVFFLDDTNHIAKIAEYLKKTQIGFRNNKNYKYKLEALPIFCTCSEQSNDNLSPQIYTLVPRQSAVTKTRNITVTKELGNYINNFLYKLSFKYYINTNPKIPLAFLFGDKEEDRKKKINKAIKEKHKYFCEKFTECPPYKPNTWLHFECLLLSVFSYFLDITFDIEFEEVTNISSKEIKENLLNKAINAIIKPKFQINGIEEFEKFFNQLKNIDNFGEKILLEKPEGEAVKQFLNDKFTIGFVKEVVENKEERKILYFKRAALEMMLSDSNINKNEFLEYMYSKQIVKGNKDGEKIRYDIKTSFKNYSSQERLYAFYI